MSRVFDSTAIDSTQKFANRLQSGLFPPQSNGVDLFLEHKFKKNEK